MPISDTECYQSGHFGRVYDHIIKPACEIAGFKPIRSDDIMTTNYIALDVIKNIIECEMALCDLSSRNPNVLYELGIRQAFNLPVTLIKDQKTNRIFDIQGFRDIEYDETLRIDNVEETIESLAETLLNTFENTHEINSLVSLLGIEPAKITGKKIISTDTELILNGLQGLDKRISEMERKISPTEILTPLPVYIEKIAIPENVGELLTVQEYSNLKIGDKLFHGRFGEGVITNIIKKGNFEVNTSVEMNFSVGQKNLILKFANLRKYK